ncbi:MAG TPA: NAD(P)/FAD-dependent oxidoreductase [Actinomycetales bacterium]|jgi:kynurenine 3-monooxygenase
MGEQRVAIIGAGLAGCLLATLLARRGLDVVVYERRDDPRVGGGETGRSINLAVSARGLDALEHVGLREHALASALPMHGRMVHPVAGEPDFQSYSADGERAINSISRTQLNHALLDTAEATPGVSLRFGHRLLDVDLAGGRLVMESADGPVEDHVDVVLASDGSYSAARRPITFRPGFSFSQDYLEQGYKELTVPAVDGEFALDPDALHIWPRGASMMIALPNLDKSFTCTLFWPQDEMAALTTPDAVERYFAQHYPDVAPLMPTLARDFLANPVGPLVTIRCWPWVHEGEGATLALVGDAAHAIVPFYGQGANCAFEDCVEIDRCLSENDGDWAKALQDYQVRRKANSDAIADMALDNFVEMAERVSSRVFRAKSAATHALERRLAGRYVSRYELVSFSTVPYAEIAGRIRRQNIALAGAAGVLVAVAAATLAAARTARR